MRKAYALLGLAFTVLFIGTWLLTTRLTSPDLTTSPMEKTFYLSSPAFDEGGIIPVRYTCDGGDINPPLAITGAPPGTKSLALIVDDPDAPAGVWDHLILYNIPPQTNEILEGALPTDAIIGTNSWGRNDYGGPCPPDREHRYVFTLYALDTELALPPESGKAEVLQAMEGHELARTQLVGRYDRAW